MKCHIETGKQHKGSITGLIMIEEPKNETVEELREKQKHMQEVIDVLTKAEETNNRTIKELQETIHYLTKSLCEQLKGVSNVWATERSK
jgi:anion-transporting  ArsA/GET3 family ATPase